LIYIETPTINSISGSVDVKVIKKKLCLLKQIGMKNVSELTPRKGKLYATAKKLIKKVNLISKKTCSLKTQLKMAKKFVISDSCNNIVDKLNKTILEFIKTS